MSMLQQTSPNLPVALLDRDRAGDEEQPCRFGLRPRVSHPYPFSTRHDTRPLRLCGRVRDRLDGPEYDGGQAA